MIYYHISFKFLGTRTRLTAKTPSRMFSEEDSCPRVCFSPSILQAVYGKSGLSSLENSFVDFCTNLVYLKSYENPSVYVVEGKFATPSYPLNDISITEEVVSYEDTDVTFLGFLDMKYLRRGKIKVTSHRLHNLGRRNLIKIFKERNLC